MRMRYAVVLVSSRQSYWWCIAFLISYTSLYQPMPTSEKNLGMKQVVTGMLVGTLFDRDQARELAQQAATSTAVPNSPKARLESCLYSFAGEIRIWG